MARDSAWRPWSARYRRVRQDLWLLEALLDDGEPWLAYEACERAWRWLHREGDRLPPMLARMAHRLERLEAQIRRRLHPHEHHTAA